MPKNNRKVTNKLMIIYCEVCGEKATGNNFNAITCESCKAFFRRNALRNNEYRCPFKGDCRIDVVTRKFCRRCRLKKCFDLGMKKEFILTDDQKRIRKSKKDKQNAKKSSNSSESDNTIDSTSGNSGDNHVLNEGVDNDLLIEVFGNNSLSDEEINNQVMEIESYIMGNNAKPIVTEVCEKAAESEFAVIPIARPITHYSHTFNELEANRLSELLSATHILKMPSVLPKVKYEVKHINQGCMDWIKMCEREILKFISVSKNLQHFKTLPESDQIILIKYGSIELFVLRLIYLYNVEKDYWRMIVDDESTSIMKMHILKGHTPRDMFGAYKKFLLSFASEWNNDPVIVDLLSAIVIFNAERPNLQQRELVKLQQHIYMHLLGRYLEMRYQSESEGRLRLLRLLNSLHSVQTLRGMHFENFSQRRPQHVGPLLTEVFNVIEING